MNVKRSMLFQIYISESRSFENRKNAFPAERSLYREAAVSNCSASMNRNCSQIIKEYDYWTSITIAILSIVVTDNI